MGLEYNEIMFSYPHIIPPSWCTGECWITLAPLLMTPCDLKACPVNDKTFLGFLFFVPFYTKM
jgi:hypothetical protein